MAGKKLGTSAVVKYNGTAIELAKAADFGITNDEAETTDNDSTNQWKEFMMANRSGTFSFTAHYDISKTQQKLLMEEIAESDGGDSQAFIYYPGGTTTGERTASFSGFISEVKQGAQNGAVVELSVTVRISGAIAVGVA